MERRMCSGRDGGLDTAERNDIRFVTEITPWEVCDWKLFCISSIQLRILVASKIARTEFEYNVFLVLVYFFYISIISNENSITSISILIIQLWSSLMNHFDKIRQSMNIIFKRTYFITLLTSIKTRLHLPQSQTTRSHHISLELRSFSINHLTHKV